MILFVVINIMASIGELAQVRGAPQGGTKDMIWGDRLQKLLQTTSSTSTFLNLIIPTTVSCTAIAIRIIHSDVEKTYA